MSDIDSLKEEIRKSPYKFICKYAEEILPFTGGKVFQILALAPVSLYLPPLMYNGLPIRSNINTFLLASSGSGKSTICRMFANFTYYPLQIKSSTATGLEEEIKDSPIFSLIVEDYSTMASDERIQKIVDGILGEEKTLDRHTAREKTHIDVNGIGLLCGVPNDVNNKLTSGNIFRTVCMGIVHNDDEHSMIGDHITKGIGVEGDYTVRDEIIADYYKTLQTIQSGDLEKDGGLQHISKIHITEEQKAKIFSKWDSFVRVFRKKAPYNWHRELHEGFRFIQAHAFLNYFNREIKNNILYCNDDDLKVTEILMQSTMMTKYSLLLGDGLAKSINSTRQFNEIMQDPKIPELTKKMIPIYMQKKKL